MQKDSKSLNILIKVNGEDKVINENITILKFIESLKINKDRVVIELNKKIINKIDFEKTILTNKDTLEIVTFVGGG